MISKLEKQNKNKSCEKKAMHFVYQCISFEGDYIHDSLFCLIIYMTSFLGVWFGNTMRAWLYVRTASEAGTRKQQAKVDVSLEKRASDRGDSAKWPWTEPAADEESAGRSWHGMGRSSTYTTACNSAIPIQANYASHSTARWVGKAAATLPTHACMFLHR